MFVILTMLCQNELHGNVTLIWDHVRSIYVIRCTLSYLNETQMVGEAIPFLFHGNFFIITVIGNDGHGSSVWGYG